MTSEHSKIKVLNKNEIVTTCDNLIAKVNSDASDQPHDETRTVVPRERITVRPIKEPSFNIRWWDERLDDLNIFRNTFPTLQTSSRGVSPLNVPMTQPQTHFHTIQPHSNTASILPPPATTEPRPWKTRRHTEPIETLQVQSESYRPVSDALQPENSQILLKFYYKPWPRQTHKLSFPQDEFRKFPEDSAAVLINYRSRMQNDDSVELGLRITAHIHRGNTPLTIIPTTSVWHILNKPHITAITEESVTSIINVNDMRRAVCPYITLNIGLSKGFCVMMLQNRHWYVILVLEASALLKELLNTLYHVSEQDHLKSTTGSIIMKEYSQHVAKLKIDDLALIVMDSMGYEPDEDGWESVRKYLFISLVQTLLTSICSAPIDSNVHGIHAMNFEQQQLHISCLSFQAVDQILWSSRFFVQGPLQCNGRSCGAYSMASIWKLSSVGGLEEMYELIRNYRNSENMASIQTIGCSSSSMKKSRKRRRSTDVPVINFDAFYDDKFVRDVIKEFDGFIRKQIIGNKRD